MRQLNFRLVILLLSIFMTSACQSRPYAPAKNKLPVMKEDAIPMVVIEPTYPQEALEKHIEGFVRFEFIIGPDGSVIKPKIIDSSDTALFEKSAIKAFKRWKFRLYFENNKPAFVLAHYTLKYSLNDKN